MSRTPKRACPSPDDGKKRIKQISIEGNIGEYGGNS